MISTSATADPFPSVSAVRAEHRELQSLYRDEGAHVVVLERIEEFVERARATGVLLYNPQDQAAVQSLVDMWASVLYKAGREIADPTLFPFDISRAPELPDSVVPYVGLDPFSEKDKDVFFGRQGLIQKILERLHSENFIAVIGPSGCGKSSLILAGVLPALRAEAGSNIRVLPRIVPGSNPLYNLAAAFQGA